MGGLAMTVPLEPRFMAERITRTAVLTRLGWSASEISHDVNVSVRTVQRYQARIRAGMGPAWWSKTRLEHNVGVPRCPVDGQWCSTCRIGGGNGTGEQCARTISVVSK
jgi:hypothetical protein